jgi:hypothetical protein
MHPYLLFFLVAYLIISCDRDPDPELKSTIGHLKIYVTYPEVIIDSNGLYFGVRKVPGEGASAKVYNKNAVCLGYKDAQIGIAWLNEKYVTTNYYSDADEKGEIRLYNIQKGEYNIVLYSSELQRYSDTVVEVHTGDTLELSKDFTRYGRYVRAWEPWYETMFEFGDTVINNSSSN